MTLEDLRVFVAACEAGSLSGLARRLGRTQSSISQHIARLEREVGEPLLERRARGVEPTAAGGILRDLALEGLDAIEVGLTRIRALRDGETRTLTVTTGGTTVRHFLKGAVARFRRRRPDVNLRFLPATSTRRCIEILRLNQADLAFVTTGDPVRGITEQAVARQRLFLLASREDPLSRRRLLRLKDLAAIRYLGLAEGTTHRGAFEQAAAAHGVELKPEIVFDDFDTANIFVELNLGHAIVPAIHAHHFERSGRVKAVPIEDLPPICVGWAFRRWSRLSEPAREFVNVFAGELRRMKRIRGLEIL